MKKSSDSTSRQFREKGTPAATKPLEIVSLSCKKRNSNANSNDIPFSKVTWPKIRILMAQYVDRSGGIDYPLNCCQRACRWVQPLAVWKDLYHNEKCLYT